MRKKTFSYPFMLSSDAYSTEQKFLYDLTHDIGFSVKDGNIIFSIKDSADVIKKIYYKLPSMGEAYSITCRS